MAETSGDEETLPDKDELPADFVVVTPADILRLAPTEGLLESPIDLRITRATNLDLPPLIWCNADKPPSKMKITNSGHTIIISGKWKTDRPYISGGPFLTSFVHSQLHFHWGADEMEGSEHHLDGSPCVAELHEVMYKSCFLTQEAAMKANDGIVVICYFFMLQNYDNPTIETFVNVLPEIKDPQTSVKLDPWPISSMVKTFNTDYLFYWGAVTTSACRHSAFWLICREPLGISKRQLESFRKIHDTNHKKQLRNFRPIQPYLNRHLFHIEPSGIKFTTLLPLKFPKHKYRED